MKYAFFAFIWISFSVFGQDPSMFTLRFEPVSIEGMIGVQSFSYAKNGDEILIIGGRLDGLHQRMSGVSFDAAGHNDQLIVVNLATKTVWKTPVASCSLPFAEQLKATNHCFTQKGDTMVLIGGYGISTAADDHATFASALRFSVSNTIAAVKNNAVSDALFQREVSDSFAVCGGQLHYINDVYYLVGGHRFDGRYNPRNGPSFTQTYTSAVRRFKWINGRPAFLPSITNSNLLHKRDYNLVKVPQGENSYELLALSGVFQEDADLPFQTTTRINEAGEVRLQPNFRQFYNHYECPEIVVYDPSTKTSHLFMMGGIAQFYDTVGKIIQDNNVPFVSTLARVVVQPDGSMEEWLLAEKMPTLLGAGSAFIPNNAAFWKQNSLQWTTSMPKELELGVLVGGIVPDAKNIFWVNNGKESKAVPTIYRVYLTQTSQTQKRNLKANDPLNVDILKHGKKNQYMVFFDLKTAAKVRVTYINTSEEVIYTKEKKVKAGTSYWKTFLPKKNGIYRIIVQTTTGDQINEWEQFLFIDE
jgi:hypothetical protein